MLKLTHQSEAPGNTAWKMKKKIARKTLCFWQIAWKCHLTLQFFEVFFPVWSTYKYFTVAVWRNRSKKRLYLIYCCFSMKSHDRKKWKVLCKRSEKKFKRLIDPRIWSLHFKETDIAITIFSRKNISSGCYSTIFDPTKERNTTSARSKRLHNWKRCWAERPKTI